MAKSDFGFHHNFRVRYSEVDAQAIVFFGNYMTYFDTAHTEYMRALGFDYRTHVETHNTDFHIVKAEVEYHAPARFDDELEVYVRTQRIGHSSMAVSFELYLKGSDKLVTSATSTMVNAVQPTMTSAPWPEDLISKIIAVEVTSVERP